MDIFSKKNTKSIGRCVELSGHVVLGAAAVVGLLAIPIALAAAESKERKSSNNHSHSSSNQPVTIIHNHNNYYYFGNWFGSSSCHSAPPLSSEEFIRGLLICSLVSSAIGMGLSLFLGVPWVAGLVGGLWVAGLGLTMLGDYLVQYADKMTDASVYVPEHSSFVACNPVPKNLASRVDEPGAPGFYPVSNQSAQPSAPPPSASPLELLDDNDDAYLYSYLFR